MIVRFKSSPGSREGHPGDTPTRPRSRTTQPLPWRELARRVGEFFTGRRQATPDKSNGLAPNERKVTLFSPPEIDHAIDRNITAIAHLMAALEQDDLDVETRDHLLLAKSEVTLSNRKLSTLIDACALCGEPGLKRVCRNCGARRGQS